MSGNIGKCSCAGPGGSLGHPCDECHRLMWVALRRLELGAFSTQHAIERLGDARRALSRYQARSRALAQSETVSEVAARRLEDSEERFRKHKALGVTLRARNGRLRAENEQLSADVQRLTHLTASLEGENADLRDCIRSLEADIETARCTEIKSLRNELQRVRVHNAELSNRVAYQQSVEWVDVLRNKIARSAGDALPPGPGLDDDIEWLLAERARLEKRAEAWRLILAATMGANDRARRYIEAALMGTPEQFDAALAEITSPDVPTGDPS